MEDCIGKMLGIQQARGVEIPLDAVEELGPLGAEYLAIKDNEVWGAAYRDAQPSALNQEDKGLLEKLFVGDGVDIARGLISSVRNPSGIFGEEFIRPVHEFITQHYADWADDIPGGRSEYFEQIEDILEYIDTSEFSAGQQTAWDGYKAFYKKGGELYGFEKQGVISKTTSNLVSNIIKSSPTVILGNIGEGAIKLPTLYPKTFIPAITELMSSGGLLKKLPELEKTGVYGVHYAGETSGIWEGLIGLTDVPLKNIAYYAGELAEGVGGGARAVQKVAFTPRFGDLPAVYYNSAGRSAVSLLSYTINSYKMYADLWRTRNFQGLITYHLLAGVVGGGIAAGVPLMGENIIKFAFPESEEWFEENKGATARLIQPGNITRLGVPYDIGASQIRRAGKDLSDGSEKLSEGDISGSLDLFTALMKLYVFTNSPIGDANIQKVLDLFISTARGDDVSVEKDLERLNPIKK